MKIEEANKGTWLGLGHPLADRRGWAADDPKLEAIYSCDHCGAMKEESAMYDEGTCLSCSYELVSSEIL